MRVPFFSRARGARIAPVGRELLASGVRVRACARSLSVFVEIQWMQSDFSGAGANGHPAFATPRHTAMRMACSAISVGDCVCGERRGAITIDLLKMPQRGVNLGGKYGLRSNTGYVVTPTTTYRLGKGGGRRSRLSSVTATMRVATLHPVFKSFARRRKPLNKNISSRSAL